MSLPIGSLVEGRYRVLSLLGHGGMGAVYRAWDTRLDVQVALKEMVVQSDLGPSTAEHLREQFHREAKILASLSHPNLVRVTDSFEWQGNAYLVMNLVQGTALDQALASHGAFSESEVIPWGIQILNALGYCHAQGVIHRDIKPQNLLIQPDGQVVLVDFGLAKLWNQHDPRTQTALRGMGTPEYAPPEQYDGSASHTDARSDLYSLAATLYHALTGQAPPTATMRIVNPRALVPLRQLNPAVSPHVEAALMRALELQPENRFPDASAMLAALYASMPRAASVPPTQRMPDYSAPPVKPFSPALLLGGGLLLFIMVVAAIFGIRGMLSARQPLGASTAPPLVTPSLPTATPLLELKAPAATTARESGTPDAPAASLPSVTPSPAATFASRVPEGTLRLYFDSNRSGDWSIYSIALNGTQETPVIRSPGRGSGDTACNPQTGQIAYDTDRDGNWEIYTADWKGANQINRTSHPADEEEPAWSMDGRYLAFRSDRTGNWDIWILDLLTQELTDVTSHPADDRHPTWSPDGEWLAFISDRSGNWDIYKVRISGAELTPVVSTPAEERFPSWSSDGGSIAYHARPTVSADFDIYVWDIADASSRRLTFAPGDDWAAAWSPDGTQIAFVSEQDGNNEIYVMDRDGRNLRRLTVDSRSDTWPCWMIVP